MRPAEAPIKIADNSFVSVNARPKTGNIRKNICGSIKGDASQKAITGANGTPARSKPAIIGTTPQEQKGEIAPNIAAARIALIGFPEKTPAIC